MLQSLALQEPLANHYSFDYGQTPFDSQSAVTSPEHDEQPATWDKTWHKVETWLKKGSSHLDSLTQGAIQPCNHAEVQQRSQKKPPRQRVAGLPRFKSFNHQLLERKNWLRSHELNADGKRACSAYRGSTAQPYIGLPSPYLSHSAPDLTCSRPGKTLEHAIYRTVDTIESSILADRTALEGLDSCISPLKTSSETDVHSITNITDITDTTDAIAEDERLLIHAELEAKWILNITIHFHDSSGGEKFFVTYADQPNKWRRLTISCDYRNTSPGSLENDLRNLKYQRDKSARIYESIRNSLRDIQFYATVTNLKLKTIDGRLHIHCSEDLNEIIAYPRFSMLQYISCPLYKESEVDFVSHMSGFVYKVNINGQDLVKKEIPGSEAIEEFLYELSALSSLRDSHNVIQFQGLVTDEHRTIVKGLVIKLAPRGALNDIIYDARFSSLLSWTRREHWARQIVRGLSEIHESGFVQGDFTLSNIVVDENDHVWLIDVNRRGCPFGWEPPELQDMIRAGQSISMFIGIKTDLFQLGMVLWAIAMSLDEPELEPHPLAPLTNAEIPDWYKDIVQSCLDPDPRKRSSARDILARFPDQYLVRTDDDNESQALTDRSIKPSSHPSCPKQFRPLKPAKSCVLLRM